MKRLLLLLSFYTLLCYSAVAQVTGHPRLFVTQQDLPTLRSWAVNSNPFYADGLKALAERTMDQVEEGVIPQEDPGGSAYSNHFTEGYAHVLAFMSLIDPDATRAQQYRQTAINLLMHIIDIADLGMLEEGTPEELRYRRRSFSTSDRSRWIGQAFPLTVDWVYDYLTADQKRKIRRVFLRWAEENINGYPNHNYFREGPPLTISPENYNSPVWLDLEFDATKKRAIRYAMNNYFNAHIRNVVMMGAAFDAEDDVADPLVSGDYDGKLREYREKFLHTWHYMSDYAYRYENNGGVSAEGGEYMPALGFTLQLLLALHTAGYDPAVWGDKISIDSNPHWERTVPALLNSLPKQRTFLLNRSGWNYQPSWFGDGEHLHVPDITDIFGPLGLYARLTNKTELLEAIKWIVAYVPPGSIEEMTSRINNKEDMTNSIMAFMIFDPASATQVANGNYPAPHDQMPPYHFAHGAGRFSNRTSWSDDASWVNYRIGFITIDHQHGDGNMFDFFRKGEWLTKERTGYGNIMGCSDYKNTLAIKRNTDDVLTEGFYGIQALKGSQLRLNNDGDPSIVATSVSEQHFFITGDATNLYNYVPDWGDPIRNVQHASRSFFWVKPDYLVVYDRVETNYNGFKQFWLNLPSATPSINGRTITASTPGGQQLVVSSLLPADADLTFVSGDTVLYTGAGIGIPEPYPAEYDPMGVVEQTNVPDPWGGDETLTLWHPMRLRVEATGNPLNTKFLHVLQGRDAAQPALATSLVSSGNGMFEGAIVGSHVVLFKTDLNDGFESFDVILPGEVESVNITGLTPLTSYATTIELLNDGSRRVSVAEGAGSTTDAGGVLSFNLLNASRNITSVTNPADITVAFGTNFNAIQLPPVVPVIFDDGSTGNLSVVFNEGSYNGNSAGTYTLTGVLVTSSNTTNTLNLTASLNIIVANLSNAAPTDIALSNNIFSEQQPSGSLVGTLSTVDSDVQDTHTYSFASGTGSDHNGMFIIENNLLRSNIVFDVASEQQLSVLIQTTDQHGASFVKQFTITVFPLTDQAKDIVSVSPLSIVTVPVGTSFNDIPLPSEVNVTYDDGTIQVIDVAFETGNYDANTPGNYELNGQLVLTAGTTNTLNLMATITVTVNNPNSAPVSITISNSIIEEQQPIGTVVGFLSTEDPNIGDTHTYSLVAGTGDEYNDLFAIAGNNVVTNSVFEVTQQVAYTIRVQTIDSHQATFDQPLEITVLPAQLFVPTLFSPNGDNANDTFRIRGNGIKSISLRVFDRFGNIVFETTDLDQATITGWDGTTKGANAPHGIYTWIIKGEFNNGAAISNDGKRSGNVLLVR